MNTPLTDQQLQHLLETNAPLPGPADQDAGELALYQQVFASLTQPLPIQPTADFSDRVLARLEPRPVVSTNWSAYGWLGAVVGGLGAGVAICAGGEASEVLGGLASVKPFASSLLFGLGSLLAWQWLDWKLVREPSLKALL